MKTITKLVFCALVLTFWMIKCQAQYNDEQLNLYGATEFGGNGYGVLFEFCPSTGQLTKVCPVPIEIYGNDIPGSLAIYEQNLYGMTFSGGINDYGTIFKWDLANNRYIKKKDFAGAEGAYPAGSFTLKDGKFYGMTLNGGDADKGVIFEWDPVSNVYTKKISFMDDSTGNSRGAYPHGDLVYFNSKFYGMTTFGGLHNKGVIFEWDPASNLMVTKYDFTNSEGCYPFGSLMMYGNIFYGTTIAGGVNNYGVIFAWDPRNNIYTVSHYFDGTNGWKTAGNLSLYNNRLYGMASHGGTNNGGVIFEFDPPSGRFVKKIDLEPLGAKTPGGSFARYSNEFYGMTYYGGINNNGVLFKWNPANNNFTVLINFNGSNGSHPYYTTLTLQNWSNIIDQASLIKQNISAVESENTPQIFYSAQHINIINKWDSPAIMKVYKMNGHLLMTYKVNQGSNVYDFDFQKSIYIVKIYHDKQEYNTKIVNM